MITDLLENVRVACDGLTANKMRATLTMLGVIIGVGAVISLLSIGEGAQAAITDQVTSIGSTLLFVSPGAYQRGPVQERGGSANTLTLADAETAALLRIKKDRPILRVEMLAFTYRNRPYEYRISHCLAEDRKLLRNYYEWKGTF